MSSEHVLLWYWVTDRLTVLKMYSIKCVIKIYYYYYYYHRHHHHHLLYAGYLYLYS